MTIYLIRYHYQQDTYNGWDWQSYWEDEFGYYTSRERAQAKADALNERDHRSSFDHYVNTQRSKHNLARQQAELLHRQNEALTEKGLPPLPGDTSARFAPDFEPIPFEEWIKTRYNRDHYYAIEAIEEAPSE